MIALPDLTRQFIADYQVLEEDVRRRRDAVAACVEVVPATPSVDTHTQQELDQCARQLAEATTRAERARAELERIRLEFQEAQKAVVAPPPVVAKSSANPVSPPQDSRLREFEIIVAKLRQEVEEMDRRLQDGQRQISLLENKLLKYRIDIL